MCRYSDLSRHIKESLTLSINVALNSKDADAAWYLMSHLHEVNNELTSQLLFIRPVQQE